jgi:hypothetical protein
MHSGNRIWDDVGISSCSMTRHAGPVWGHTDEWVAPPLLVWLNMDCSKALVVPSLPSSQSRRADLTDVKLPATPQAANILNN